MKKRNKEGREKIILTKKRFPLTITNTQHIGMLQVIKKEGET